MDAIEVTLPGGFNVERTWCREAYLRPLAGQDESFLEEAVQALLPAQQTTALLTRCLTRLGPLAPVTSEAVRSLTVGDREALLLHLRRLTIGERMSCIVNCPDRECGKRMDLELNVSDLLVPPYQHTKDQYETGVNDNGIVYQVHFRLPTGADQETAARLARDNAPAAADLVLRRCVERVTIAGEPIDECPLVVIQQLPAIMAALDPQAEVILRLTCPVCGHAFSALFDVATYFFQEVAGRMRHLYREVHLLALHYHWSEAEIMAMTARKRRLYLDLLAETLADGGIKDEQFRSQSSATGRRGDTAGGVATTLAVHIFARPADAARCRVAWAQGSWPEEQAMLEPALETVPLHHRVPQLVVPLLDTAPGGTLLPSSAPGSGIDRSEAGPVNTAETRAPSLTQAPEEMQTHSGTFARSQTSSTVMPTAISPTPQLPPPDSPEPVLAMVEPVAHEMTLIGLSVVRPAPIQSPALPALEKPAAMPSEPRPIQVRIGTIEVRATTPPAPAPPPAPMPQGFDDYVLVRNYVNRGQY